MTAAKRSRLSPIALLVIALGLAGWLANRQDPAFPDKKPASPPLATASADEDHQGARSQRPHGQSD